MCLFGLSFSLTATQASQLIFFYLTTMMFHFVKKKAKPRIFSKIYSNKALPQTVIVAVLRA